MFDDCLSDAGANEPIEEPWVIEVLLSEGLKFAGQIVFAGSGGVIGPGSARLWDNVVSHGPNGSGATVFQGPWPWLTALCPKTSSYEEYGNTISFRPVPGGSHVWQNYQYSQTCSFTPDTKGNIAVNCSREHPPVPPPPPPGSPPSFGGGPECPGGFGYNVGNDCLRIPAQQPGGSFKLRGFNFITPTVKVRMQHTANPSIVIEQECTVWGDRETPVKYDKDHYIVDERVRDWVDVAIPSAHPTMPGVPFPAGIYSVNVVVKNVTNAIYDGSAPAEFNTNRLLLRIEAHPSIKYSAWSERGHCNRETPGAGSDEIWWDAFVGHLVPNAVPVPPSGAAATEFKADHKSFPRGPWDDMDDGEDAGAFNQSIFGPAAFEQYGVAVMAILGFEVDSESAARDQIEGFADAYWEALKSIWQAVMTGEGIIVGVGELAVKAGLIAAKAAFTYVLVAMAAVLAAVLISLVFWAAWAPADLIAIDLVTFDALSAWDATDPIVPLPPVNQLKMGDVSVTQTPQPKLHKPGDAAATWIASHQYDTPDDGEDASYTLEFRLART